MKPSTFVGIVGIILMLLGVVLAGVTGNPWIAWGVIGTGLLTLLGSTIRTGDGDK